MQVFNGVNLIHAKKYRSELGTYINILLEVEFTDWKLKPLQGRRIFVWIYYDEFQRKYYINSMFDEQGHVKTERKDLSWATMKDILDFVKANPDDEIDLPSSTFCPENRPDNPKKAGWLDKIKGIFKR